MKGQVHNRRVRDLREDHDLIDIVKGLVRDHRVIGEIEIEIPGVRIVRVLDLHVIRGLMTLVMIGRVRRRAMKGKENANAEEKVYRRWERLVLLYVVLLYG